MVKGKDFPGLFSSSKGLQYLYIKENKKRGAGKLFLVLPKLKGLGHEMDMNFADMGGYIVLGLKKGRGMFLNFSDDPIPEKIVLCAWIRSNREGWTRSIVEWLKRLSASFKVGTVLGSIPAFSDAIESEGRQMKQ
jgi:hypothetical protein